MYRLAKTYALSAKRQQTAERPRMLQFLPKVHDDFSLHIIFNDRANFYFKGKPELNGNIFTLLFD